VRDKWWGLCDETLINPLNTEDDQAKKKKQIDLDWKAFEKLIKAEVKPFHTSIEGKYHPVTYAFFGSHESKLSFGTVTWTRVGTGNIPTDPLAGKIKPGTDTLFHSRVVDAPLLNNRQGLTVIRNYALQPQDQPGDGTVPHRSGIAPLKHAHVKSMLQVDVGHEPAYKESVLAQQFTLRAIVQIAQQVKQTSLHYT
jgi:hypothetical protein